MRSISSCTLWYARHAKVVKAGVCYGQSEVEVGESPRAAVDVLARSFPDAQLPLRIWSSPLARCAEVARELSRLWGAELCIDRRLQELDFGLWEGRSWSEIEASEPQALSAWMNDWQRAAPPGGETTAQIEARARSYVASLAELHSQGLCDTAGEAGADVLIAHAGFIRALEVALLGRSWDDVMQRQIQHLTWAKLVLPLAPNA